MINIAQDMKEGQGLMGSQTYLGVVIANNDSAETKNPFTGRIKIRISGVFDGIPDEHIPWAIPSWSHSEGSSEFTGTVAIPKVGTTVSVKFQGGDPHSPIYGNAPVNETSMLAEAKTNYPNRTVSRMSNGDLIMTDTETNEHFIRTTGDSKIYIQGNAYMNVDGDVIEQIKGNKTTFIGGNLTETVLGTRNSFTSGQQAIVATGNLLLEGAEIHENSGGAPSPPGPPAAPEWPGVPEVGNAKIPTAYT
jgi:uncharacterized protein involved in type VI secretion and phage assembly